MDTVDQVIDQIKQLFDKFKELHPLSKEEYNPTIENISRWRWMVKSSENPVIHKPFELADIKDRKRAESIAESRAVGVFSRMPVSTQRKFMRITSIFTGRIVYACGSRVTGHWIDKGCGEEVMFMRKTLLRKDTEVSDYDIFIEPNEGDDILQMRSMLPSYADLVLILPHGEPKILIDMWNFDNLPKSEHNAAIEAYNKKQWGVLMEMHNKYQLSNVTFCCDHAPAKLWFEWAIQNGKIKHTENG